MVHPVAWDPNFRFPCTIECPSVSKISPARKSWSCAPPHTHPFSPHNPISPDLNLGKITRPITEEGGGSRSEKIREKKSRKKPLFFYWLRGRRKNRLQARGVAAVLFKFFSSFWKKKKGNGWRRKSTAVAPRAEKRGGNNMAIEAFFCCFLFFFFGGKSRQVPDGEKKWHRVYYRAGENLRWVDNGWTSRAQRQFCARCMTCAHKGLPEGKTRRRMAIHSPEQKPQNGLFRKICLNKNIFPAPRNIYSAKSSDDAEVIMGSCRKEEKVLAKKAGKGSARTKTGSGGEQRGGEKTMVQFHRNRHTTNSLAHRPQKEEEKRDIPAPKENFPCFPFYTDIPLPLIMGNRLEGWKGKKPLPKFWSSATWFRISQGETIFLRHSIMEGGRAIENSISFYFRFPPFSVLLLRGGNLLNRASGFASAKTVSDKAKAKVYLPATADSQLGYRRKCKSITLIF